MSLKRSIRPLWRNATLVISTALAFALGILSPIRVSADFNVLSAQAQPADTSELSVSNPDRANLIDLIEEFDSKINDINANNPEMAKINADSFSGGHMNYQTGEMEEKFG